MGYNSERRYPVWKKIISTVIVWTLLTLWVVFFTKAAIASWQTSKWLFSVFSILAIILPTLHLGLLLGKRRAREESKRKTVETIGKMEEKQIAFRSVRRKPGNYRPWNWSSKWLSYSNDIPAPKRGNIEIGLPRLPRINEERKQN